MQIYYDSSVDSNTFDDGSFLNFIRDAIMCLNESNKALDLSHRCPVQNSGGVGRPRLDVIKGQLQTCQLSRFARKTPAFVA